MSAGRLHCLQGVNEKIVEHGTQEFRVAHYLRHVLMLDDRDGDVLFGGFGLDDTQAVFDNAACPDRLKVRFCRPRVVEKIRYLRIDACDLVLELRGELVECSTVLLIERCIFRPQMVERQVDVIERVTYLMRDRGTEA